MLRKLFELILVVSIITMITLYINKDLDYNKNIDNIIESKIKMREYDGYLYIPKFDYKGLIKSGKDKEVLDSNNILHFNNGCNLNDEYGNIVLAGHNNKYVFSILYKLSIGDDLIVYENNTEYKFKIYKIIIVNITDTYILNNIDNNKMITLITCTKDNQNRLVVIGEFVNP